MGNRGSLLRLSLKILFTFIMAFQSIAIALSSSETNTKTHQRVLRSLKNYKVLIFGSNIKDEPLWFSEDFKTLKRLLEKNGFTEISDFEVIMTDSNESPEFSALDVIKAVRDSQKSVFIWSSSKASADVLDALLRHQELQSKIKGFISVQGTVGGALKAESIKSVESVETSMRAEKMSVVQALRSLVDYIYSFSSQYSQSLYSLNPDVRHKYLVGHDYEIRELSKKVPMLYVGRRDKARFSTIDHSSSLLLRNIEVARLSRADLTLYLLSHFVSVYGGLE